LATSVYFWQFMTIVLHISPVFCHNKLRKIRGNSVNVEQLVFNWSVMTLWTDLRTYGYLPWHRTAVPAARHKECFVVESEMERMARVRVESARPAS